MPSTIDPEPLTHDGSGSPFSARYGDRYASRAGALGQARHVFLGGNHLPARWSGRRQFVILETGFGLGNNFLATWQAWRADPARPERLHFLSVEKHPLAAQDIAGAGKRFAGIAGGAEETDDGELAELRTALAGQWPPLLAGLHRLEFEGGCVVLTIALGDARELVPQLSAGVDAFYLDGFAPERNPQMWEPALLRALARLARPQATLATYTVAASVREGLRAQGFAVERVPGFGVKRHMLRAQFAPRWKVRRHEPPGAHAGSRRVIVVGAGLAGCCSALALARRGWHVTLLERGSAPADGASGLPVGVVYPLLSADDNLASRLSRAAFGYALRLLRESPPPRHDSQAEPARATGTPGSATVWHACGVFQQAADPIAEKALRERLRRDGWPDTFVRFEDAATAARHLGLRPRHGGAWFPSGCIVDGGRWCHELLARAREVGAKSGGALEVACGFAVAKLARSGDQWQVENADAIAHRAPVVVLANAADLVPLLGMAHLPLAALGGCLSLVDGRPLEGLRAAVGGEGYVVPPLLGRAAVGATYEIAPGAPADRAGRAPEHVPVAGHPSASSAANLQRLAQLLRDPPVLQVQAEFHAARCVSADRFPLAGALGDEALVLRQRAQFAGAHLADLPRQAGLFCLAALGSRGLTLAPLLGEILAAQITGEPAPVEASLCAAVDPARFLLRHLRAPPGTPATGSGALAAPPADGMVD